MQLELFQHKSFYRFFYRTKCQLNRLNSKQNIFRTHCLFKCKCHLYHQYKRHNLTINSIWWTGCERPTSRCKMIFLPESIAWIVRLDVSSTCWQSTVFLMNDTVRSLKMPARHSHWTDGTIRCSNASKAQSIGWTEAMATRTQY